jgi:hypothetical protein
MKRRTQVGLVVGGLAVATVVAGAIALERSMDQHSCRIAFPSVHCSFKWSTTPAAQSTTAAPSTATSATPLQQTTINRSGSYSAVAAGYAETIQWAVMDLCSEDYIAERRACATAASAREANDELQAQLSGVAGLPLPRRWALATTQNSPFIKSVHVETPLDLAAVLDFYRAALSKRGWTENDGAVVAPDRAVIAFTTSNGPALLRLVRAPADSAWVSTGEDDRTIADLSMRKPAAANETDIVPSHGQAKLLFGNGTDQAAVITINDQTFTLAARAGRDFTDEGRKLPDSPGIDLPPGKYKITFKVASGAAHERELEVAADETLGLLVGPAGVPLPVRLY